MILALLIPAADVDDVSLLLPLFMGRWSSCNRLEAPEASMWFLVAFASLRENPTAADYSASASAMEPLIAKNREKLRNAQKTGYGNMAWVANKIDGYWWCNYRGTIPH